MCFFWLFLLGNEARPNEIDSEISQTVRNLDKISMTKNVFDSRVETTLTAEKKICYQGKYGQRLEKMRLL